MRTLVAVVLCAWVLWQKASLGGTSDWAVMMAEETKAECDTRARTVLARKVSQMPAARADGRLVIEGMIMIEKHADGALTRTVLYCLPSGTDPRPRGKD